MRKMLISIGIVGVVTLIFYSRQNVHTGNREDKGELKLDREISELKAADQTVSEKDRKEYRNRAKKDTKDLVAVEAEEKEIKAQAKKDGTDLDAAMKEMEAKEAAKAKK